MAPEGVTVVSRLPHVSAADPRRPRPPARRGRADRRRPQGAQAARGGADRAQIDGLRPVDCGRLETARFIEGLTPLLISTNIRHKTHAGVKLTGLPEDSGSGSPALRRHRRRQARPRPARRRRRAHGGRQHRRRRRVLRGARLPRPGPDHLLARRRDRRARLRHLRDDTLEGDGRAASRRPRRLVPPRRPRPGSLPAAHRAAARGATADRGARRGRRGATACARAVLPMCDEPVRTLRPVPRRLADRSRSS